MQNIGNSERTDVQVLCDEILDDVEILTNLVYLLKDQRTTPADQRLYLKLTEERMTDLRSIIRKHYDLDISRFN
jgi:hypothetical protein